MITISCFEAKEMLNAYLLGKKEFEVSLNLGISKSNVKLKEDNFIFPNKTKVTLKELKKISENYKNCFTMLDGKLTKVQLFNEDTNKFYKLVPTKKNSPPTHEVSGIKMHDTKVYDPLTITKDKIKTLAPIQGNILDTCTGLGYTAIHCMNLNAKKVTTCEIDDNVLRIAEFNPWSKQIFDNKNIEIIHGDISNKIKIMHSNSFDRIIHDPPNVSLATLLYSFKFYHELFRILKKGGKLFHYDGSIGTKKKSPNLIKNICERLKRAGFVNVKPCQNGVFAEK